MYTIPEGESLILPDGTMNPNATLGYKDATNYFIDDVVVGDHSGIGTPTGVKSYLGFTRATFLGSNEDDTVGTASDIRTPPTTSYPMTGRKAPIMTVSVRSTTLAYRAVPIVSTTWYRHHILLTKV